MIGNTLGEVIEMVRDEARLSTNTSRGTDNLANIKRLIKRHYQMLLDDYDWQHLEIKRADSQKILLPNSSVYDFPEKLNTERIAQAWVYYGSQWVPMEYGISFEEMNCQNTDDGDGSTWPEHWDFSGDKQFEVWPMPSSGDVRVGFDGQRKAAPIVNNDSIIELDDIMISLFVAAEILAANSQKDAAIKLKAADNRLLQMRRGKADKRRIAIGRGQVPQSGAHRPRTITHVR